MTVADFKSPTVQRLRRLLGRRSERYDERCFVVEGRVLVSEAVAAGWNCELQAVPVESNAAIDGAGRVVELAPGVLERTASTSTPQAPLAIVAMPEKIDRTALLSTATFVVVLVAVSDPGNLGTIMRSAEAAGADAIVLTPGSVDPFNPKVVRSSAGALFHLPVVDATLDEVSAAGFELMGTSSHIFPGRSVLDYSDADLTGRVALVMGNEAAGLPDHWTDQVGPIATWLTIRHQGRSESLNVAMAATVLVFEAARQRAKEVEQPIR